MRKRRFAEFLFFLTTFIWASTFATAKTALVDISPMLMVSIRFVIASMVVFLIWRKEILSMTWRAFKAGMLLGTLLGLGLILQTVGLKYTTASNAAFITGMLVVFTPIAQIVIERRPPKLGNIVGIIFVVVGLWFLTSPEGTAFNVGDGMTLIAAVLFGIYIVYLDMFTKVLSVIQLFFLQLAVTLVLAFFGTVAFESFSFRVTTNVILSIAYLAIFATILSTFVQTKYQRETTPTRAALIFSLEPVIAAWLAYLMLDERMGPLGMVGGGIIIVGILVSQFSESFKILSLQIGFRPEEIE